MSYCRWSSDDFQCDVYVYESIDGTWITHVASNRPVINREGLPPIIDGDFLSYHTRSEEVMKRLHACERVDIGLPHDGKTFCDETAKDCADTLAMLKEMGYNVPQRVIEELNEEAE